MRAILYTRQSITDEGETLSLDSQAAALRRWADEQGWAVVGEVRDADAKGYDETRPGLAELLRRSEAREIDLVLVWSIDRLARSVRIQENVLHELNRRGVEVRSLKEPWVAQALFRQILGAIAEEQTRTIAGHVRRALGERTQRGLPHGVAPFGYVRDDLTRKLAPGDPEQVRIVREVFARYANGSGFTDVARWLNGQGVATVTGRSYWHASSVRVLLGNPAYRGAVRSGGVVVEDAHPAIIDAATWDAVEARRGARRYQKPKPYTSPSEGNIVHGCGAAMYLRSPSRPHHAWYFQCYARWQYQPEGFAPAHVCDVRPASISAPRVEREAWVLATGALRRLLTVERVKREQARLEREQGPGAQRERERMTERRGRLQQRRALAEELYLGGRRDRAWFDAQDASISGELAGVEQALRAMPAGLDMAELAGRRAALADLADYLGGIDEADRGPVLRELGVVVVEAGGVVAIRWRDEVRPFIPPRFQ